jgi:hypothetical protein
MQKKTVLRIPKRRIVKTCKTDKQIESPIASQSEIKTPEKPNVVVSELSPPKQDIRSLLAKLTVAQIKEQCSKLGVSIPSGLRKKELIEFFHAAQTLKENSNKPVTVQHKTASELDLIPKYADPSKDWSQHLDEFGWCVVPIPDFNPQCYVDAFYDWLELCCNEFKRNDRSTWKVKNLPINLHGIFKNYIGHIDSLWEIREKCIPIFAKLWGTDDLLSSFDGACFLYKKPRGQHNAYFHLDQGKFSFDRISVQGIVNLLDNGPDSGGLTLIEGSHKVFKNYCDRHPLEGFTWNNTDMSDPELSKLPAIKVCLRAGEMALWDSRVVHTNTAPLDDSIRMVTYVSMQPRSFADEAMLKKRISWFEMCRMTNHWCSGTWSHMNSENPRTYGHQISHHPLDINVPTLNKVQRRLVGDDD